VKANLLDGIIQSLETVSMPFEIFDEVLPNAPLSKVYKGLENLRKKSCDYLLAVGGGSPIDTAKVIGCLATNPGPIHDYAGADKYSIPPLPIVAIPTTAGTGSEVSFSAVVYDEEAQYKFSVRSYLQLPKVALLDPQLLRATPSGLAAASGMDALTHCIEAYTSDWANLMTDAYCKQNFYLVGRYLRRFVADPTDIEAASAMLQASSLGAMAFNAARVGLAHGLGLPLGTHFHLSHGLACGIALPPVMRYNLMACPARFIDIAMGLEGSVQGNSEMEKAYCAVKAVENLLNDCSVSVSLDLSNENEELLSILAEETLKTGLQISNPRKASKNDVINIYKDLFQAMSTNGNYKLGVNAVPTFNR
jgi:alcohol dehydrogenase class IV